MGGNPKVRVAPDVLRRIDAQKRANEVRGDVLARAMDALEDGEMQVNLTVDGLQTATTLTP